MRDLPPQAKALTLDTPAQPFLDLPLTHWVVVALLPDALLPDLARFRIGSTAPPDDRRPHAAPVGIVRLQT